MSVSRRALGSQGLEVSAMGLGCMGLSDSYGTSADRDEQDSSATIHRSAELGFTGLDTADADGPYTNEALVGRAIAGHRDEYEIATKFGFARLPDGTQRINGRPDYVRAACDVSLQRLGIDVIDLYYHHRLDRSVPVAETIGAMAELVQAGKVRFLGISEMGMDTIRIAHEVHPISAVQSEYSLFARDVEAEVLPLLRELGIGFVAYSPLGRGLLTGSVHSVADLPAGDVRRERFPRFRDENLATNLVLAEQVAAIAAGKGVTPAQLALAWVLAKSTDIVPIPGTKRRARLEENSAAADIELTGDDMERLDAAIPAAEVRGVRHWDMAAIDT